MTTTTKTGRVTTTIGLAITHDHADQILIRKLDRLKTKRGFKARTQLIRTLILEEWERTFPRTEGGAK